MGLCPVILRLRLERDIRELDLNKGAGTCAFNFLLTGF